MPFNTFCFKDSVPVWGGCDFLPISFFIILFLCLFHTDFIHLNLQCYISHGPGICSRSWISFEGKTAFVLKVYLVPSDDDTVLVQRVYVVIPHSCSDTGQETDSKYVINYKGTCTTECISTGRLQLSQKHVNTLSRKYKYINLRELEHVCCTLFLLLGTYSLSANGVPYKSLNRAFQVCAVRRR